MARLGAGATGYVVDNTDKRSLAGFFERIPSLTHLFTPGAPYVTGSIRDSSDDDAESPFRSKFWGQYYAIKAALPRLAPDGAIVLMSGAAGARPVGAPAYAACNSAIEGLGRGLAVELAPIRVNVVAPGTTDSAQRAPPMPATPRFRFCTGSAASTKSRTRSSSCSPTAS